jgi:hypothetical protein
MSESVDITAVRYRFMTTPYVFITVLSSGPGFLRQ